MKTRNGTPTARPPPAYPLLMPLTQPTGQGLGAFADPNPLPPAPFFERYLLQDPIPTTVFLIIIAVFGWWWLNRIGKPRPALVCAAGFALGAAVVPLLARFVVTEREKLVQSCTELVQSTLEFRASEVDRYLRSDATASVPQIRAEYTRAAIIDLVEKQEPSRRGVKEASLKWVTSTLDGPNVARTQCRVQVQMPLYEAWMPTTWMVHWTRTDANAPWKVRRIEAEQIGLR